MAGFMEEVLSVEEAVKALSPEAKVERRRAQWRRYSASEKGRTRGARYRSTPERRARKKEYMKTYNWNYAATINGQLARFRADIRRSIRVHESRLNALANELENSAA